MKITGFLDQDGPLADFDTAVNNNPRGIWKDDPPEMFEKKFFRNLPVTAGAKDAVQEMIDMGIELYVLTKPTIKKLDKGLFYCPSEKYEWMAEHFPFLVRRMFLACDKAFIKPPTDGEFFLVDDYPEKWGDTFQGDFFSFDVVEPKKSWEIIVADIKKRYNL